MKSKIKIYLRIRVVVTQDKLPILIIVSSLNVTCLFDMIGEDVHYLREFAAGDCCTHFNVIFKK